MQHGTTYCCSILEVGLYAARHYLLLQYPGGGAAALLYSMHDAVLWRWGFMQYGTNLCCSILAVRLQHCTTLCMMQCSGNEASAPHYTLCCSILEVGLQHCTTMHDAMFWRWAPALASFPGLPRFSSSVYVQYNTRKRKSAKNGEGLISFVT